MCSVEQIQFVPFCSYLDYALPYSTFELNCEINRRQRYQRLRIETLVAVYHTLARPRHQEVNTCQREWVWGRMGGNTY